MRQLLVCLLFLLLSFSAFAELTNIGISVGGGIDILKEEGTRSETYPQIACLADFYFPNKSISLRTGLEYAWKSYDFGIFGQYKVKQMIILLAGQKNVVSTNAPVIFYFGAGGEMTIIKVSVEGAGEDSDNRFGILTYMGINYDIGKLGIFAEGGLGLGFAKDSDSEIYNFVHLPIRGGIKFNL